LLGITQMILSTSKAELYTDEISNLKVSSEDRQVSIKAFKYSFSQTAIKMLSFSQNTQGRRRFFTSNICATLLQLA
jgi:hypothetical protein